LDRFALEAAIGASIKSSPRSRLNNNEVEPSPLTLYNAYRCRLKLKREIQLEIAHVLFIDIGGYSKLSVNEQRTAVARS